MTTQVAERYRLVTRSDFDGLVCAALLKELGILDDILFVHPKDMQDGKVELTDRDITTNLPYVPGVHLSFDHHDSETIRVEDSPENHVIVPGAKSAARVVYDYYGGAEALHARRRGHHGRGRQGRRRATSSREDILEPQGWDYISFLMDPRTGLGRFRDFRISNYQLMMQLIDDITTKSIEEILATPDVAERVELYREHADAAIDQVARCGTQHGNLVVLDFRDEDTIYATNRFTVYALWPQCNISIHILWGLRQQNTVFATGKSILDRSPGPTSASSCSRYGGGGHRPPAPARCPTRTPSASWPS